MAGRFARFRIRNHILDGAMGCIFSWAGGSMTNIMYQFMIVNTMTGAVQSSDFYMQKLDAIEAANAWRGKLWVWDKGPIRCVDTGPTKGGFSL